MDIERNDPDLVLTGTDAHDKPVTYEYRGYAVGRVTDGDGAVVGWQTLIGNGYDPYPVFPTLDEAFDHINAKTEA